MALENKRRALCGARRFSSEAQSHSSRGPKRSNAANAAQKNPGASPGKRYVIQRIGAFGQLKPCERQRHDAVACRSAGAAVSRAGANDAFKSRSRASPKSEA